MLEKPFDGNHGAIHPKASDYVSVGIPFIMANNLVGGKVDYNSCHFISYSQANSLKKGFAKPGDVLLTHKATIGRTAIVGGEYPSIILTPQVTYYRVKKGINKRYLKYYFDSNPFQQLFQNWSGAGSTRAYLGITEQLKLPIVLPSLAEQNSIAATLSSLDDKIELNNRIIANLEAQAQAIFKSWFVDFEPFQDGELEESELGLIPKGWRVGTLKDICHYSNDRVAVDTLNDETYVSTENMLPNKQGFVKATSLPTTAYTTAYHAGDVLISNIRPYFKKIVYCYGKGGCSTDVICFVANDGVPSEYLFHLLYNDTFFDFMVGGSKGTKMPRGDKQQLMQYPVAKPDSNWLGKFEKTVQPMLLQSYTLKQENERLAQTRDTLLPKLMSGEIEETVEG